MALHAHKSVLKVSTDTTDGNYAVIGEVLKFDWQGSAEMVETKSLDTTDFHKTFLPGWMSWKATASFQWTPAKSGASNTQRQMLESLKSGLTSGTKTAEYFKIEPINSVANDKDIKFRAFVMDIQFTVDVNGLLEGSITLQGTASPTTP